MPNKLTLVKELNTGLGKVATSFGRLSKRGWYNKILYTKLKVDHVYVLSILLYGATTWTTYRKQETKQLPFKMPTYDA